VSSSRIRWPRAEFALLACYAITLPLAGCGGSASQARTRYQDPHPLPADTLTVQVPEIGEYGGRFVIGQTNPPKTFNGIMANETSSTDIIDRMFTTLVGFDHATETLYPQLAKSWELGADGLTWTFRLRDGARFSDGEPLTSADVAFSFEIAYDQDLHPAIQDLLKAAGKPFQIETPDAHTVVIRTPIPNSVMPVLMTSLRIMPKHRLEAAFRSGDFASAYSVNTAPESVITSHAWRLKQYVAGQKIVLERNPHWLGVDPKGQRLPYLDELVYVIVPDQNTAALKFQSGELDAVDNVKAEDFSTFEDGAKAGDYTVHDLGPALNTNFLWFNLNRVRTPTPGKKLGATQVSGVKYSWFSDARFRRAVSKAIDREAIIRGPFFGHAVKNWSQSTAGNRTWYTPDIVAHDYDPEGAKALIAEMGYRDRDGDGIVEDPQGNTVSFTLKSNGDNAVRVAMMNLIRDDLAKIGVRCIPTPQDFNTLITNFRQDFNYEAGLLGLQSGTPPDPGQAQNVWMSSGLTHYWNIRQPKPETAAEAQIDALMDSLTVTADLARRKEHWRQIQNLVNQECFIVWLPTLKARIPIRNKFGNLQPSVMAHRVLWNIDRVYVKTRTPA
jgi:peptide/nickel transport system substrate-binding protein